MLITKSRIENFDDCRVGDILYEDPDDDSHDWKLYTKQNRITAKLKSRSILPGALVASIEKKGLNVQTISVYNDDSAKYTTYSTSGSFTTGTINYPAPLRGSTASKHTGGISAGGGTNKLPPPKSKTVSTPIPVGKFVGKFIGKLIRKVR